MQAQIKRLPKEEIPCKFFSDVNCGGDFISEDMDCYADRSAQCSAYSPAEVKVCERHAAEYAIMCIDCETEWSEAR